MDQLNIQKKKWTLRDTLKKDAKITLFATKGNKVNSPRITVVGRSVDVIIN